MNNRPFREIMHCPITDKNEEVFFYEVEHEGQQKLWFRGCDHQFHESNIVCQNCHKEAYQKLISRT